MKHRFHGSIALPLAAIGLSLCTGPIATAQTIKTRVPSINKRVGEAGGSIGISPEPGKSEVTYSTVLKLTASRVWKNAQGKEITAELMSWPIIMAKAPTDPATVPFSLIKEGKIRLRQGAQVHSVVLTTLSPEDQAVVKRIEAQAKAEGKLLAQ